MEDKCKIKSDLYNNILKQGLSLVCQVRVLDGAHSVKMIVLEQH